VIEMSSGKTIGLGLFIGGIILLIVYGLYLGFEEIVASLDYITGFLVLLIILGLIILIASIVVEQRKDAEKMMKEIKKEDLEP
jgi:uncharacterized membrane protein